MVKVKELLSEYILRWCIFSTVLILLVQHNLCKKQGFQFLKLVVLEIVYPYCELTMSMSMCVLQECVQVYLKPI